MPAVTGINFLLQIEDSGNPGTYIDLGGQRNATLNTSMNIADSTNKTSGGWSENLPTFRSWSITFDSLFITADAQMLELRNAYLNNTQLNVRLNDSVSVETYTGLASISDLSIDGPFDDVMILAGTLTGSGALTIA